MEHKQTLHLLYYLSEIITDDIERKKILRIAGANHLIIKFEYSIIHPTITNRIEKTTKISA